MEKLRQVYMRQQDYEHMMKNLKYRARYLHDLVSLETLEFIRANNPKMEE
jgi:hypothetical protein